MENALLKTIDIKMVYNNLCIVFHIKYGSSSQMITSAIFHPGLDTNKCILLYEILKLFDKEWFSDIKDVPIRIYTKDGHVSIGHFMYDKWLEIT